MTYLRRSLVVLALVVATVTVASAQPAAPAQPPAPYSSPMRAQCSEEIEKDAGWRADITARFEQLAHVKAADSIKRNERHVFIAYAVIWVLVAGLVGVMWMRQLKLNDEIRRLRGELTRIEREDAERAEAKKKKKDGDA